MTEVPMVCKVFPEFSMADGELKIDKSKSPGLDYIMEKNLKWIEGNREFVNQVNESIHILVQKIAKDYK